MLLVMIIEHLSDLSTIPVHYLFLTTVTITIIILMVLGVTLRRYLDRIWVHGNFYKFKIMNQDLKNLEMKKDLIDKCVEIIEESICIFGTGIADFDGFALFKCLPVIDNGIQFIDFLSAAENTVFLNNKVTDDVKIFGEIGKELPRQLILVHDLALDPNSDDVFAAIILMAIHKIRLLSGQESSLVFCSVAGDTETRRLRAALISHIFSSVDVDGWSSYYLSVSNGVSPTKFISSAAMKYAGISPEDVMEFPGDSVMGGFVFISGHLEQNETLPIADGATVAAQTDPVNGNFNLSKSSPLMPRVSISHSQPYMLTMAQYSQLVPPVVNVVNKVARVTMIMSENSNFTRVTHTGRWSTAFTRCFGIENASSFYKTLHPKLLALLDSK